MQRARFRLIAFRFCFWESLMLSNQFWDLQKEVKQVVDSTASSSSSVVLWDQSTKECFLPVFLLLLNSISSVCEISLWRNKFEFFFLGWSQLGVLYFEIGSHPVKSGQKVFFDSAIFHYSSLFALCKSKIIIARSDLSWINSSKKYHNHHQQHHHRIVEQQLVAIIIDHPPLNSTHSLTHTHAYSSR